MHRESSRSNLRKRGDEMKIVDVLAYPVYVEANKPISGYLPLETELGKKVRRGYSACFVKVITDDGTYGFGESLVREVPQATAQVVESLLKRIIVGQNPLETDVLWEEMFGALKTRGHYKGYFIEALSGVDIALWDLKGKVFDQPVYSLLGGKFQKSLKAYASSVLFGEPEVMARKAMEWVNEGFDQIKVKVGMGVKRDEKNLRMIRDEVGYDVEIMVDANSAYDFSRALRLGRILESLDIYWFEEPVPPYDLKGYRQLKKKLDVPICGGESHFTRYDFKELVSSECIDIVQSDVARAGGISECVKILNLARAFNLPYTPHIGLSGAGCRAASIHLSASIPADAFLSYEIYNLKESPNPLAGDICDSPIEILSEGYLKVNDKAGLGLEIDEEKLKTYLLAC
jgi:D-arabinonate dehydratase/D-galactarolactone cycloisomerase